MAVLDEIETCHTESAPLCSVPSDGADEQSCRADRVLSLFANQEVCVKTVKNDDWLRFVHQLNSGPFRTSVSLPPPGGRRMCLFGRVSAGAVGVIFDRRKLDLSKAFIWPSGYYAKTEFNLTFDRHNNAELTGGREQHLVTIDALLEVRGWGDGWLGLRLGLGLSDEPESEP